ncbi:MAG: toprim domain-containing protein [Deltaproteobacteria bacterium]|nr:toprim domain-containing protein [Deltaproteobacteria bacterium]
MDIGEFLARLDGVRRSGTGWVARCPAHDDHNASLSIGTGADGRILLNCFAGCTPWEVTKAMELTLADLFFEGGSGQGVAKVKHTNNIQKPTKDFQAILQRAKPACKDHPYLLTKKVEPCPGLKQLNATLLVPVTNAKGDITGIQRISASGEKKFLAGSKVSGNFFRILGDEAGGIFVCEGFATGLTIRKSTGGTIYVAFSAGNLKSVAQVVREKHPEAEITICADNDQWTEGNPGLAAAREAAWAVDGQLAVPRFKNTDTRPTDFNDLAILEGANAVVKNLAETVRNPKPKTQKKKDAVEKAIEELNSKHAVVMVGGRCCILNEIADPIHGRPDITLSTVADFKTRYANRKIPVEKERNGEIVTEPAPVAKLWIENKHRRTYENGLVFEPSRKEISGAYNLFRGLAVKPDAKGRCEKYLCHIHDVIARRNEELFKYVVEWMAWKVQHLGKRRSEVALVLRGPRGAGKGCFVQGFGRIFGKHFIHVTNQNHVVGRFNSALKDALLVYVDEGFWAGDKQAEGVLKGLITEDVVNIELKGKDLFQVRNHANFIIASNNNWVVPAGPLERRFCVIDVSGEKVGNRQYFKAIFDEMSNDGVGALLHLLQNYDLTGFDPNNFPKTDALVDQVLRTMGTVGKFWVEALTDGDGEIFGEWIPTDELYNRYIEFCETVKNRHPLTNKVFIRELKTLWPAGVKRGRPVIGDVRKWGYEIPDLEQCRAAFEGHIGLKIDWEEK